MGVSFTRQQVISSLTPLGFSCIDHPTEAALLNVGVPDWRNDVQESADLVEEVARQLGFDKIPATLMRNVISIAPEPAEQAK